MCDQFWTSLLEIAGLIALPFVGLAFVFLFTYIAYFFTTRP